jgi:DNA-directed RNA polymerase specialized sigma24 family protein
MTLEQALTDHDKMIWGCANMAGEKYHQSSDELYSYGRHLVITKIFPSWSPERGKFSTHLTRCLHNAFLDLVKAKKSRLLEFVEVLPEQPVQELKDASLFETVGNAVEWDSMEALDVIREMIQGEELDLCGRREGKAIVRQRLLSLGWAGEAVTAAFSDIRKALR